jgi:hypothetical protein
MRPVTVAAVQVTHYLADRNVGLMRRHADVLLGAATSAFRYGSTNAG